MEQQQHLKDLTERRDKLQKELEELQSQATTKRELFLKIQGIIEYLTQIGVTLPEEAPAEEPVEEASTEG
jgi:prefoldin subunit 5